MYHQPSFLDVIEEYLESEEIRLPAFSRNALRIQKEAFSAEPDFSTIQELIECDQALTSQVIRKANTAFYRGLTKVNTVQEAILRIGTGQIASIVMMITQKTNYDSKDPLISEYMKRLWNHSLAVANASNWLAERCGYPNLMDQAYVAGLLHDVGKLLLLMVMEDIQKKRKNAPEFLESFIHETLETLHTREGHRLLKQWNLPETYCDICLHHHDDTVDGNNILILIIQMANLAANKMGFSLKGPSDLLLAASSIAQRLKLSEIDTVELEIFMEDNLEISPLPMTA